MITVTRYLFRLTLLAAAIAISAMPHMASAGAATQPVVKPNKVAPVEPTTYIIGVTVTDQGGNTRTSKVDMNSNYFNHELNSPDPEVSQMTARNLLGGNVVGHVHIVFFGDL